MSKVSSTLSGVALAVGITGAAQAQPLKSPSMTEDIQTRAQLVTNGNQSKAQLASTLSKLSNTTLNIDGNEITFGVDYSKIRGAALKFGIARLVGNSGALAIDFKVGKEEKEFLAQYGLIVSEGAIMKISFAHLEQFMEFAFPSGKAGTNISQNTIGATLRIRGGDLVRFFELAGYRIDTKSQDLGSKIYSLDTAQYFELWQDARRIAGSTTTGLEATAQLVISDSGDVTIDLTGGVNRRVRDTIAPSPIEHQKVFAAKLAFPLFRIADIKGYVGIRREGTGATATETIMAGVTGSGLQAEISQVSSGNTKNPRIMLSYRVPLNADFTSALSKPPTNPTTLSNAQANSDTPHLGKVYHQSEMIQSESTPQNPSSPSSQAPFAYTAKDVLGMVKGHPGYVPTDIAANVMIDPSANRRLVRIDKQNIPESIKIDTATGITTIPLPSIPGSIESVKNITNGRDIVGVFSVVGNGLVFQPQDLERYLTSGSNTIEIKTTNHIVSITVRKGSVVITGIDVMAKEVDAATMISAPLFSNISQTSVTVTPQISDPDGVKDISCQLQSSAGVDIGLPVVPVNGVCTFAVSPNTTYKVVVTAKAARKDERGNIASWESVSSVGTFTSLGLNDPVTPFGENVTVTLGDIPMTRTMTSNLSGAISYSSSNPAIASVDPTTGRVTFHAVGSVTITATQVASGTFTAKTLSYIIKIVAPVPVNNAPVFGNIPTITVTAGVAGSVILPAATDPENDSLTYTVGTLPSGFVFNPNSRELSWGTGVGGGNFSFGLNASDGSLGTTVQVFVNVNAPADTTPDNFSFNSQTGVARNSSVDSNSINITGINQAVGISIIGGTYSINGGTFTNSSGTVTNGQSVVVRLQSSSNFNTLTSATLTVGGVSRNFSATTLAFVTPNLPSSLPDIDYGGDGGGSIISFIINMPTALDINGNQIAYTLSGLPTSSDAGPLSWTVNQTGSTLNITSNQPYMGFGFGGAINTFPLTITSPSGTGSTTVNLKIQNV